jgi:crotonobetainyl-CoA:carnitine CoA-transferase CaiB-like acyl-CoA transferase
MSGAAVIKVESTRRLDGARSGPPKFFDLMHGGHRSVTLDLSSDAGQHQLHDLIDSADVVIEASRPRALRQMGIEAQEFVGRGVTWLSITAYGRTGPWANRVGFGDDAAAAGGLVAWLDGVPVPAGDAIADPLSGAYAAAAVSAALLSDRGWLLDVSMRDVARSAAATASGPTGEEYVARAPRSRPVMQPAPAPGADNDALLFAPSVT